MKKLSILLTLVMSSILFYSCDKTIKGEGEIVQQVKSVDNFTQVISNIKDPVIVTQGGDFKVVLKGQQNIIDNIRVYAQYGKLRIEYKDDAKFSNYKPVEVLVNLPVLTNASVENGTMNLLGKFQSNKLNFRVNGVGVILADEVAVDTLSADIFGKGQLKVNQGNVVKETISTFGNSYADMIGVVADTAIVKLSGSGDIYVNVLEFLDVNISGSGDVYYKGQPDIQQQIKGTGSLKSKE